MASLDKIIYSCFPPTENGYAHPPKNLDQVNPENMELLKEVFIEANNYLENFAKS